MILQIFSPVYYDWILSIEKHLNFADLDVSLRLPTFCIIFPTSLRTGISPEFTWVFIDWVSVGFFPGVLSPWPKKKRHREKSLQKMFLQPPSRENAIFATSITPSEISNDSYIPRVLLLGCNFSDLIYDFLFFYDDIFLWNFE